MAIVLFAGMLTACISGSDEPAGTAVSPTATNSDSSDTERPDNIAQATCVYSCPNCAQEQNWYINENHIVYWEDEPYIPHAINDYPAMRPFMAEADVREILTRIDILVDYGVTEIPVELGYLMEEYLPDILADSGKEAFTQNELNALQKEMEDTLAIIINHITERGGTYILISSVDPVVQQLGGSDIVLHEVGSGLQEGTRSLSIEFMLDEKTQQAYRAYLRGFRQSAATGGLRGFLFNWETNGQGKIEGSPEDLATELGKILDIYGQMIKEEIGDVPVFYGLAGSVTGLNVVLPYLSGVCAENIDGLYIQIHGAMPEEVRFRADQSLVTRQLNTCSRTKLFWGYGQATPLSFVLYRSQSLMREHFEIMADVGMTGFMYDQVSSWGYIELGMPFDSEELRNQNKQWWGAIKPALQEKILRYAAANEFSTGKWAVPVQPEELKSQTPKVLTPEQVLEITLADPEIERIVDMGAEPGDPLFNPDYGLWDVYLHGIGVDIWIEDSEEGNILLNGVKLVDDARQAGYPVPSNEWLINYRRSQESDDD